MRVPPDALFQIRDTSPQLGTAPFDLTDPSRRLTEQQLLWEILRELQAVRRGLDHWESCRGSVRIRRWTRQLIAYLRGIRWRF